MEYTAGRPVPLKKKALFQESWDETDKGVENLDLIFKHHLNPAVAEDLAIEEISAGHYAVIDELPIPDTALTKIDPGASSSLLGETLEPRRPEVKNKLQRFPHARFPKLVYLSDIIPLEIVIKITGSGEPLSISIEDAKKNASKVPINLIISSDAFEVVDYQGSKIGSVAQRTIFVPIEEKDSDPVLLMLKARRIGSQYIFVEFYQNGSYLGKYIIGTEVLPEAQKEVSEIGS
jgi:hypothetical protein